MGDNNSLERLVGELLPGHLGIYAQFEAGQINVTDFLSSYLKAVSAFEKANKLFLNRFNPGSPGFKYKLYEFEVGSLFGKAFPSKKGEEVSVSQKSSFSLFNVFGGAKLPSVGKLEDLSGVLNENLQDFILPGSDVITPETLLLDALQVSKILKGMSVNQSVFIAANDDCVEVSGIARVNDYYVEDLLFSVESIEVRHGQLLEVKKPEYIDKSAWSFVYNGKVIVAKIIDEDWLESFQRGVISIPPGTKLLVDLVVSKVKGPGGKSLKEKFAVQEIGGKV